MLVCMSEKAKVLFDLSPSRKNYQPVETWTEADVGEYVLFELSKYLSFSLRVQSIPPFLFRSLSLDLYRLSDSISPTFILPN